MFTVEELKQYDGVNGMPAYIAYKGKVYDVSTSYLWKDGKHQRIHSGGVDLTDSLARAPHDEESLIGFAIVGRMASDC